MRPSIVLKLWAASFGLVLAVLLPLGLAVNQTFTNFHHRQEAQHLLDHGTILAGMLGDEGMTAMMLPMVAEMAGAGAVVVGSDGQTLLQAGLPAEADLGLSRGSIAAVLAGRVVVARDVPFGGEPYTAVAVPVPGPGGRAERALILLSPAAAAAATLRSVRGLLLLAGAGAILLSTGLAFVLSVTLARPLIRIEQATRTIARGDFTVRLPVVGRDEVTLLAGAINELAGELDRFERGRREFLANVSHELRTPLSYLRGYSQALVDGLVETPAEQARYHQIILEEAIRLGRLVEDLMDLAQMEEGRLALHRERLNVEDVTRKALGKLAPQAEAQGVILDHGLPTALPLVWADLGRIEQVVINLVHNALRHTPAGGRVTVLAAESDGFTRVTVKDTGSGIPTEELPLIWERFHKVDKSRARDRGGRGLGLAIVRSIVRAHGGEVGADSEPGQGTAIWFTLPIARGDEGGVRVGRL